VSQQNVCCNNRALMSVHGALALAVAARRSSP